MKYRLRYLPLAAALALSSCTDPVRDMGVERLGPEADGVSPGPLHRPGQPCLVCHSEYGPASNKPFAVAGTVFEKSTGDAPPTTPITIHLRDSMNNSPGVFMTNEVGNFYITADQWSDITFPLRVGIERNGKQSEMTSTVNREGSCNFCHKPAAGSRYALPTDEPRTSVGQIDFERAQ